MMPSAPFKPEWIADNNTVAMKQYILDNAIQSLKYHQQEISKHQESLTYWQNVINTINATPSQSNRNSINSPAGSPYIKPVVVSNTPVVISSNSESSIAKRASVFQQQPYYPTSSTNTTNIPVSTVSVKDRLNSFENRSSNSSNFYSPKTTRVVPPPNPATSLHASQKFNNSIDLSQGTNNNNNFNRSSEFTDSKNRSSITKSVGSTTQPYKNTNTASQHTTEIKDDLVVPTISNQYCRAIYAYAGNVENNVYDLKEGDLFELLNTEGDWWLAHRVGTSDPEESGFLPRNYVERCETPNPPPPSVMTYINAVNNPPSKEEDDEEPASPLPTEDPGNEPESDFESEHEGDYSDDEEDHVSLPVLALYDYQNDDPSFLCFVANECLTIIDNIEGEQWWLARNIKGNRGYVPSNYMKLM